MHGTAQKAGRPLSSPDPLCQSPKSPFLSPPTLSSPTLTPLPRLSPAAAALALTFLSPASHDSLALLLLPFKQRAPASHRSSLSPLLILQPAFSVPSAARFMARKRTARPPPPPPPNPNPNRRTAAAPPASGSGTAPSPSTKRMLAFHFLRALSRIHSSTPVPRRSRTIRRAAYSSMARAANPRRAWTQALLRQVRVRRAMRTRRAVLLRRRVSAAPPAAAAPAAAAPPLAGSGNIVVTAGGETSAAATHRPPPRQAGEPARADALRRLVPGGGEMEYVSLLDETADYVRCLRAQVQLMQNLVDLFSGQ